MYTEKEYKKLEKQLKNYVWGFNAGQEADIYLLNQNAALANFVDEVVACLTELIEKIEKKKKK